MTFVGFATTLIIPVVFGKLSPSAITISKSMVILMAFFMPVWVLVNAQQAIARSGGDTKMGAYADAGITIAVIVLIIAGIIHAPIWCVLLNPFVFQLVGFLFRASKLDIFIDAPSCCAASMGLASYGLLALLCL